MAEGFYDYEPARYEYRVLLLDGPLDNLSTEKEAPTGPPSRWCLRPAGEP